MKACAHHSHYPYSCDGEGRQADRQDDPGSHWAGSELALSQAWVERADSGRSDDTVQGIRWGGVAGSVTHRGNTQGGGRGDTKGHKDASAPRTLRPTFNLTEETKVLLAH